MGVKELVTRDRNVGSREYICERECPRAEDGKMRGIIETQVTICQHTPLM